MIALLLAAWIACAATAPAPPGAPPRRPEVARALAEAAAAEAPPFHTRHLDAEGRPRFTNRLVLESSPYLRQHAHNPVDWRPWGEAAFALARELGRPVFLSVGYATCHWCHVMAEESFEDLEIARLINARYVAIKVDREELPDVDAAYMAAVRAATGGGGWPMTLWLTPDGEPFYADTFIPARDGDRGARVGLLTLLAKLADAWAEDPEGVRETAARVAARVKADLAADLAGALPGEDALDRADAAIRRSYDPLHGGVRGRHKFPSSLPLRYLLAESRRTGAEDLRGMARTTLDAMAAGGIRDQLGGGFHRYATEPTWTVPHFERMLYDNAILARIYVESWLAGGPGAHREVAEGVLAFLDDVLGDPAGGFRSATDADSPGPDGAPAEGRYFTWTPAEVRAAAGADAAVALAWYDVDEDGEVDGRSVLTARHSPEELGRRLDLAPEAVEAAVARAASAMRAARDRRAPPAVDDKVIAAWNGLAISAFAVAGRALDDPALVERAERAAAFVLDRMVAADGGEARLRRSWRAGRAAHPAMLEDQAFVAAGLLDLFEATADRRWLDAARERAEAVERRYARPEGGWFRTPDDAPVVLARPLPDPGGPTPFPAAVMIEDELRLAELTGDERWRRRAEAGLRSVGGLLARAPAAAPEALLALDRARAGAAEIVVVGPTPASRRPFVEAALRSAPRHRVILDLPEDRAAALADAVPLVAGKVARDGLPTAYLCRNFTCGPPATDLAAWRALLAADAAR